MKYKKARRLLGFFVCRLSFVTVRGLAEFGGHVGFFPGEVRKISSEMSAIGSLCENRPGKFEMVNHPFGVIGKNFLTIWLIFFSLIFAVPWVLT